jgi:hypothetical protein
MKAEGDGTIVVHRWPRQLWPLGPFFLAGCPPCYSCHMSRSPKKQASEATTPKQHRWAIYRLKGTPAALLGDVQAPDEETAIERAIEEFGITNPQLQKRLFAQRRS